MKQSQLHIFVFCLAPHFTTTAYFEKRDKLMAYLPTYWVLYYKWDEDSPRPEPWPTAQQNIGINIFFWVCYLAAKKQALLTLQTLRSLDEAMFWPKTSAPDTNRLTLAGFSMIRSFPRPTATLYVKKSQIKFVQRPQPLLQVLQSMAFTLDLWHFIIILNTNVKKDIFISRVQTIWAKLSVIQVSQMMRGCLI